MLCASSSKFTNCGKLHSPITRLFNPRKHFPIGQYSCDRVRPDQIQFNFINKGKFFDLRFSLGAQTAGMVGSSMKSGKLKRVTGTTLNKA